MNIISLTEMKPMILTNIFIYSNTLIYWTDKEEYKKQIVERIVFDRPCINSQVVVEVAE